MVWAVGLNSGSGGQWLGMTPRSCSTSSPRPLLRPGLGFRGASFPRHPPRVSSAFETISSMSNYRCSCRLFCVALEPFNRIGTYTRLSKSRWRFKSHIGPSKTPVASIRVREGFRTLQIIVSLRPAHSGKFPGSKSVRLQFNPFAGPCCEPLRRCAVEVDRVLGFRVNSSGFQA